MSEKNQNRLLILAILTSLVTYLFWNYLPKNSFYIGIAITFMLLSIYIFIIKKNFWTFFFLSIAFNNLIDECFLDPTKLGWNEILLTIAIPAIYYYYGRNKRVL